MGQLILITGGARSGKSSFAEKYASSLSEEVAYIATSQVFDEEMDYRVKLHQERRPATWKTYEAPFDLPKTIVKASQDYRIILLDCITAYISNILCNMPADYSSDEFFSLGKKAIGQLIEAIEAENVTLVAVTNEVGDGIVPMNKMARDFRDMAGIANQLLAGAARDVYLVVAGLPVNIKKLAEQIDRENI